MRLIDKEKLINDIVKKYGRTDLILDIDAQPTIDAEPVRHGKWKCIKDEIFADRHYCSCCEEGAIWSFEGEVLSEHCPHCGAKMDLEVDDETD